MSAQIRLPRPTDDRPRVALVLAAALIGAVLGVSAVVVGTLGSSAAPLERSADGRAERRFGAAPRARPTAQRQSQGSHSGAATAATAPNLATADAAPQVIAPAAPAGPVAEPAPIAAAVPPTPSTGPEPRPEADLAAAGDQPSSRVTQVVPGRVAYVRCDGLSVSSGPYPCPRDRVLEAAIWDLLDTLRACRGARPTADERGAELRLDFRGATIVEASFRAPDPGHRGVEASLERCLLEPLHRIESKLRPAHMVVSFRFQLL